ncbi:MAG: Co2+/Mg2+ efflux protein ApaG [Planctomycetota bacterium]|nr:MAG: Co2+/Mg2+ efflux protein ApaG [Planctomycetota bacterium]
MAKQSGHSDTTTDGIRIQVAAQFVPEHSDPDNGQFVYAYRVVVTNEGELAARLLKRYWLILDSENHKREVRGSGVVGHQPRLEPGESFQYMSWCPLPTEWGSMEGHYGMERDNGDEFEAAVGRFFLAPNTAPISEMETPEEGQTSVLL